MFSCTSEECKISLDLFFDLVGGATIDALKRRARGGEVSTENSSEQFTQFFNKEDHRFFHWNDEFKRFVVEVLHIKILTFLDLLKKVSAFCLRNQNAKIDLSDKNTIVSISPSKGSLPLIWNFSVELPPLEDQGTNDIKKKSVKNQSRQFDNSSDDTISYQKTDLPLENKRTKPPSVFYRLGKILLRSLLVNDWNTMEEIDEQIKKMTGAIEEIRSKKLNGLDAVRNVALQEMEQSKEIFASNNIIYQESDRLRSQGIIAEEIWDEIIVFAFNLLTAENHPDFIENEKNVNSRNLDINLDRFVNQLEGISRLIKVELFHEQFQKSDIAEVLNAFLTADQSVSD